MTMTSSFVLTKRSFEVAINGTNTSFPEEAVSSFI